MEKFILGFVPIVLLLCGFPFFIINNFLFTGIFVAFVALCLLVYGIFSGKIKVFG